MSDDINLLTDGGDANKVTKKVVKGLKEINKDLTDIEKEQLKFQNKVDQMVKRDKDRSLSRNFRYLRQSGFTPTQARQQLANLMKMPAHTAYAYLANQGAPQNVLASVLRNAPPGAAAHIQNQLSYQQQQMIGKTSPVPYTPGGPNPNTQFMNGYIQQGINFGLGQGGRPQSSWGENIKTAGNEVAQVFSKVAMAGAGLAAGIATVMGTVRSGESARVSLDKEKNTADRSIDQASSLLGIDRSVLQAGFAQGGTDALSMINAAHDMAITKRMPGNARSLLLQGLRAGRRTGRYDLASGLMTNQDRAGLSRLARSQVSEANENLLEYNMINEVGLRGFKGASGMDKAAEIAQKRRLADNTEFENLYGVLGANAMQEVTNQEVFSNSNLNMDIKIKGGQALPRSGGTRDPSFDSVNGRGQAVTNLTVENMKTAPTINPYPSR